jgi:hypothetical protein
MLRKGYLTEHNVSGEWIGSPCERLDVVSRMDPSESADNCDAVA